MLVTPPFDDSQQKDLRRSTSNPWTATTDVDAYRQGVELTEPKHYTQGMVKIHAGYNGQTGRHDVPQFVYGQTQKAFLDEVYHRDVLPTDPAAYVNENASLSNVIVDKGVDLDVDVDNFDGVLEPFHIRDVVARRRTFKQFERKICGALGEGNVETRDRSDVFVSIVKSTDVTVGSFAMLDNVDTMGGLVTTTESGSSNVRRVGPFIENYFTKGIMTSAKMSSDLKIALSAMKPSTVNILPDDYTQVGSTGFDY